MRDRMQDIPHGVGYRVRNKGAFAGMLVVCNYDLEKLENMFKLAFSVEAEVEKDDVMCAVEDLGDGTFWIVTDIPSDRMQVPKVSHWLTELCLSSETECEEVHLER